MKDPSRLVRSGIFVLLGSSALGLGFAPWFYLPADRRLGFWPTLPVLSDNLRRLKYFDGGFADSLLGLAFFFALSAWFLSAGKILLRLLIPDAFERCSRLEMISLRWLLGSWAASLVGLAL